MNWKSTMNVAQLVIAMVLNSITLSFADTSVEWKVRKTFQLEAEPIDVAVSPDGKRIFVLTEQGQILIYLSGGPLKGKIAVGNQFDNINVSPRGNNLILSSRKNKSVQVIALDFLYDINVSGSPFKGSEDAAVIVAVFDDFQ